MKKTITSIHKTARGTIRSVYKRITHAILTYPERSFFGVLGVLFLLIIAGSIIGKPRIAPESGSVTPKQTTLYSIGSAPRIQVSGQIESSGVVKIVAQTSGIVQQIYTSPGASTYQGSQIMWLSTNYQGGTLPTVTRQIAQKNYDFVHDTYDAQKDMIAKQRQLADSAQQQASDLRTITNNSIGDTQNLINLDSDIVTSLDSQITALEASNVGGVNDALILQAKQGKAGALAGLNSLKVAIANAQYQVSSSNQPTTLSNTQHDLAIAQLDLQQKSLDLNRELAGLNLRVAQVSEAMMYPSSPVSGVVERIYVQPGQNVSSGTLLATITSSKKTSNIVVLLPQGTAQHISRLEASKIIVGGVSFDAYPRYISTQPTDGALYSVLYSVPPEKEDLMANGGSVIVELPIGMASSTAAVPYVPLDAIYQTQNESYVYVATTSATGVLQAKSKKVTLGDVYGDYVEVTTGLVSNDQVVTTRNVVDGDTLTIE